MVKKRKLSKKGKKILIISFFIFITMISILFIKFLLTTNKKNNHIIEESKLYTLKIDIPESKNKEIEKEIDKWIEDSKQELIDHSEEGKEQIEETGAKYDLIITSSSSSYHDITTIHLVKFLYIGGSHYMREDKSFSYNEKTKQQVFLKDYFKENSNYLTKLSELSYFKIMEKGETEKRNFDETWIKSGTEPKEENFQHYEFTDSGLTILFPPYQVACWADGEIKITIPYNEIKNIINFEYEEKTNSVNSEINRQERDLSKFTNKKLIAITFDDGPAGKTTSYLLDQLKEHDWKVTFFVLGNRVKQYPDIVRRAYEEGHEIGSHTYNHLNLKKLQDYEVYKEITHTNQLIEQTIGSIPKYLRPPYGSTNDQIKEIGNMATILWDVDTEDWKSRNADSIYKEIMKNAHDGAIILLHDLYQTSIDGAIKAMTELEKQGYTFVTIDEMFKIKQLEFDITKSYFGF